MRWILNKNNVEDELLLEKENALKAALCDLYITLPAKATIRTLYI